ncbi:aspartic peptidase domain-containing protein [Suillus spraguei]|nr:aspartic peptidase domain-containing protein [Suillus spraguei]
MSWCHHSILTRNTLADDPTRTIPTVTDFLYEQGTIELTFGEPDYTKFTGNTKYTPIAATLSSSRFWGIDQGITYGTTTILHTTAGIVDSGSTLIYIASDVYRWATCAHVDQCSTELGFHIGGETFILIPNAQIWPRSLNTRLNGSIDGVIYLIVADVDTGSRFGFINGYAFLQRFYSAFEGSSR